MLEGQHHRRLISTEIITPSIEVSFPITISTEPTYHGLMDNNATPMPNDDRTYFYESDRNGEWTQYPQDLEFNCIMYYAVEGYEATPQGKSFAMNEAYFQRALANRRARAVKMTDGRWFTYVSYALNGE